MLQPEEVTQIGDLNLNDGDKSLQQQLQEYKQALREEWEADQPKNSEEDVEKITERARNLLVSITPDAASTLKYLANHAVSEQVRMSASRYILDNALGKTGAFTPEDPLAKLVDELTKNKPKTKTPDS